MTAANLPPWQKLRSGEQCEACGHKGYCMHSPTTIYCMFKPEGAYHTFTDKAGSPVYLHHLTGIAATTPYRVERHDERPNWATPDPIACGIIYTMMFREFAKPAAPPFGIAADAKRFGEYAEAVQAIQCAFYLTDPDGLVRRLADEGRTQDAKNAGILYPEGHERAGQLVNWLKHRKLYAWLDPQGYVREIRGRALGKSTHKVLSLAGSRVDRGADAAWYQQGQLAECSGHIRIAGGHEKADAHIVAGLPCVGNNEGQASDNMIAALSAAGVILATVTIDGEDPKEGRTLSEGQRLGLAIGDRLEAAGIAVRIAEPLRSPGEPKLDADTILRDHGPEALRDIDRRAIPLSLYRRRLGVAPPDHDPEQVRRLQETVQLERQKSQRAQTMLTSVMQIRRNKHIKAERDTLIACILDVDAETAAGKADPEGWVKQPASRVAEAVGKTEPIARGHIERGVKWGMLERKVVEEFDQFGARRTPAFIRLKDDSDHLLANLVVFTPPTVDEETGEETKTWGGKRDVCPACLSKRTHRETRVVCDDCGNISEPIAETKPLTPDEAVAALRAEHEPDEPRADAESVPPTPVTPEENGDPIDPDGCSVPGCRGHVRPRHRRNDKLQYCDMHQPDNMAHLNQLVNPPTFIIHDAPPQGRSCTAASTIEGTDWGAVPLALYTGPGAACAVCNDPMYARQGKPQLCQHCLSERAHAELLEAVAD